MSTEKPTNEIKDNMRKRSKKNEELENNELVLDFGSDEESKVSNNSAKDKEVGNFLLNRTKRRKVVEEDKSLPDDIENNDNHSEVEDAAWEDDNDDNEYK
jgi:hypothetical protein